MRRIVLALLLLLATSAAAAAATGTIATVAGTGSPGFNGDGIQARLALLSEPAGVTGLADGTVLIADRSNHRIRRVAPDGTITTLAGNGVPGFGGDDGLATSAQLNRPSAVVRTPDGGLLIADTGNNRIRRVSSAGIITTVAGGNPSFTNDGQLATNARVPEPTDVALTADGGFLIASQDGDRIRKVSAGGIISTVAGTGEGDFSGDDGLATDAELDGPTGVAVTADGGFLIADAFNRRVRRVSPAGRITTVAGNGEAAPGGDGGLATAAALAQPTGVATTADGGFLIADSGGNAVRRVAPGGLISTLAGTGASGDGPDGGQATAAKLTEPNAVAVDAGGDVLIADTGNDRVRRVDAGDPTGPAPGPVPLPPGSAERNLTPPRILFVRASAGRADYRCTDGTWQGLAPGPGLLHTWWRVASLGKRPPRQIATGPLLQLGADRAGARVFCRVEAKMASGATISARSAVEVLTGRSVAGPRVVVPTAVYGDFRIRGIDVYQTVQPNSAAQRFGVPSGVFPFFCGAGTPTSYRFSPIGKLGCGLGTRDPARVDYAGVTLDQRKRTVAAVYVNMTGAAHAASTTQELEVTLRARVGGRLLSGAVTRRITDPEPAPSAVVGVDERGGRRFATPFEVPASWLAVAVLQRRTLTLEAEAALPIGAPFSECDPLAASLVALRTCAASDDRFRLDGIPVADDLAELRVKSVPLLAFSGQTINPPTQVLAGVTDLFPGGTRIDVLPYDSSIDISGAAVLQLSDVQCTFFRAIPDIPFIPGDQSRQADLRGCRKAGVNAAIDAWQARDAQNREGYDVLLAVHNYLSDGATIEGGWKRGSGTILTERITIAVNDGSAGRPLTAVGHEFGHALGAPHADFTDPGCGGNTGDQEGEPWPPDQRGRLQGTAFGQNAGGARNDTPIVDSDDPPVASVKGELYDFMSYCASDANAWLSAYNWNRYMATLQDERASREAQAGPAPRTVRGTAFVSGVVGTGGATITQVVPAGPDNLVPDADPASAVRVRSLDAAGRLLAEAGARVTELHIDGGTEPVGLFMAPLPAGTAAVELVVDGAVSDRRARSAAPTVRLLAPRAGARVPRALTVRWRSADPDTAAAARSAIVEYAPDGRTFRSVRTGPDTGLAVVPAGRLAAGRRARVRVVVNDGFSEARAVSGPIAVAGRPPVAQIVAPVGRARLSAGAPTVLDGRAVDDRGTLLRGRALAWFAGARRLGTGGRLTTTLPPGVVRLRLVARDRLGRTATVTRRVRVAPVPLGLTALRAPERVARGARRARVVVATSVEAQVRAGGGRFPVGPRARALLVPLPARPRAGVLRVPLRVTPIGGGRAAARTTLLILRV